MGIKIGAKLGKVEESELYQYPNNVTLIKIKAIIDTTKAIKLGFFMGSHKERAIWIDFRYEGLPGFCFNCGVIGHYEDTCSAPKKSTGNPNFINPLGPWLRSTKYGRRLIDPSERKFSSNPMNSLSYGSYSPIPQGMIKKMADLALASKEKKRNEGKQQKDQHYNTENEQQEKEKMAISNNSIISASASGHMDLDMAGLRMETSQHQ